MKLPTTNGTMAPTTKQIWQGVGTDKGDDSVSGELLQMDLVA